MPNVRKGRFATTLNQGVLSKAASSDTKTIYTTGSWRHKKNRKRQASQDSALDGESSGHSRHTPTGGRCMGVRQLLKTRFESSNSTYINALTNLSKKAVVFYREAHKDLSKTLTESIAEI